MSVIHFNRPKHGAPLGSVVYGDKPVKDLGVTVARFEAQPWVKLARAAGRDPFTLDAPARELLADICKLVKES